MWARMSGEQMIDKEVAMSEQFDKGEATDKLISGVLRECAGISQKVEQDALENVNSLILLCSANPKQFGQYREILLEIEKAIKEEYGE